MNKIFKKFVPLAVLSVAALTLGVLSFIFPREVELAASDVRHWLGMDREKVVMADKIQKGIALLKASPPLEYEESGKRQIALAVYDRKKDRIFESRIWMTPYGEIISSDLPAGEAGLPVRIKWWNTFNSVYEIEGRGDLVVVANKFLIQRSRLPEQTTLLLSVDAPQSTYTDMVYAPYSEEIHLPDVVLAGKKYVENKVEKAIEELREAEVVSRAYPGRLVADTVSEDLIKTIVLVEHVDPGSFLFADDGGASLVERVLVIIGANREWAYRYTNSPADASGLAQFIKPTYELMLQRYPEAGLIQNYQLGMADHTNAFKAAALLFDNELKEMQNSIKIPVTDEMLAAAYNGGPSRVIRAVGRDKERWAESALLAPETRDYMKKYKAISKLGIF